MKYQVKISNDYASTEFISEDVNEEELKLLFPQCKIDISSVSQNQEEQIQYLKDLLQKVEGTPKS